MPGTWRLLSAVWAQKGTMIDTTAKHLSMGQAHWVGHAVNNCVCLLCVPWCCVQVADRLTSMGVPCNLVTGQEIRRVKGARHTACTVEMADLTTRVDVRHCSMSNSSKSGLHTDSSALWTLSAPWVGILGETQHLWTCTCFCSSALGTL
jgi:hypothetical protein